MDTVWTKLEKESADVHKHSLAYQWPMLEITSHVYIIVFDNMALIFPLLNYD